MASESIAHSAIFTIDSERIRARGIIGIYIYSYTTNKKQEERISGRRQVSARKKTAIMMSHHPRVLSQRGIEIQNPLSFQRSSGGRYTPSTKKAEDETTCGLP